MYEEAKHCYPQCEFFKCGQRALIPRGRTSYCRWAETNCTGSTCNYAICVRGRLLADGLCGLSVKRKTAEPMEPEPKEIETEVDLRLRNRLLRRVKGEDLI